MNRLGGDKDSENPQATDEKLKTMATSKKLLMINYLTDKIRKEKEQ